jgi:uncharacterized membrane protein
MNFLRLIQLIAVIGIVYGLLTTNFELAFIAFVVSVIIRIARWLRGND